MKTYWDSSALIEALHAPRLRSRIRRGENGTRPHSLAEVFSCNAANCFVRAESRRQRIRSWK